MKAGEDVTGQKFGRLTAVRFDSLRGAKHRYANWEFACDCGDHVVARLSNVKFGARVSCGRARRWPLGGPLTHVQQYRRDHRAPKHSRCERWQARFQRVVQSPSADFAWAAAALKAEAREITPWQEERTMGEAARRKAVGNYTFTGRSWATGRIEVVANDVPCFSWQGTRQDMADVMASYDTTAAANGWPPESYAKRAAGYLMLYGMPAVGDADRRPSNHGQRWDQLNADAYRMAILWLALRETVPDTGYPLVNMVVGKAVVVLFSGDRQGLLEDTWREMAGKPFSGDEFQMMVGISDPDLRLDPDKAVAMHERDLLTMAGKQVPANHPDDMIYVPRIPVDAAEADAMLKMMTVFMDATRAAPGIDPKSLIRTYAGYTEEELRRDQPIVRIR